MMHAQERSMDRSPLISDKKSIGYYIEDESQYSWIQQLFTSSSLLTKPPEGYNTSPSIMALPEMALQPSISAEFDPLNDQEKQQDLPKKTQVHDFLEDEVVTQVLLDNWPSCLMEKRRAPLKRSRSAKLHSISERRRRDRINKKLKILQDLLPHCKKSDKASILEDAVAHIKTLKSHVETMSKSGYRDLANQQMPSGMTFPAVSPFIPISPFLGFGISGFCSAPFVPFFQYPIARELMSRNCCCDRHHCSEAFNSLGVSSNTTATLSSDSSVLEVGEQLSNKPDSGSTKL